mgnify:CR=1 FL=1
MYIIFKYTAEKGLATSLRESKSKYKVAHWLQEISRTVISFKLSGKTKLAMQKSDVLVDEYLNYREKHFKILILQFVQMVGFKVLVTAGLLLIGGFLVLDQRMNIGQFVAAEIIIILVINSVEKLILGLESFYDVLTSIEKLGQVVDKPIESQKGEIINPDADLIIELKDVVYKIPERNTPIIQDVSFTINPKDRILIEGESGSGKSSLLQLISGVIMPSSGYIYVNNLSIESLFINQYRASLGLSLIDETPFEGTIRENITFWDKSISDNTIYEVFENLNLTEFLKQQAEGLHTIIKPEGKQMAYTTAKKLVLARAIIKNPKVLILENPLDQFHIEEALQIIKFLTKKSQSWSLLVVSNNESWKTNCNKTITLKRGTNVY